MQRVTVFPVTCGLFETKDSVYALFLAPPKSPLSGGLFRGSLPDKGGLGWVSSTISISNKYNSLFFLSVPVSALAGLPPARRQKLYLYADADLVFRTRRALSMRPVCHARHGARAKR